MPEFRGQTSVSLPYSFSLQYVSQGNTIALEPTLSFDYSIVINNINSVPSSVVLVHKRLSIKIDDIDSKLPSVISNYPLSLSCIFYFSYSTYC